MQHASLCRYIEETFVSELSFLVTFPFHILKLCLEVLLVAYLVKILTVSSVVHLFAHSFYFLVVDVHLIMREAYSHKLSSLLK